MAKENKPAVAYSLPREMGKVGIGNGYTAEPSQMGGLNMSTGAFNLKGYNPAPKTTGIKIRGTGAATKGVKARGPMA